MAFWHLRAAGREEIHPIGMIINKKGMRPSPMMKKKRQSPARDFLWRPRKSKESRPEPLDEKRTSPLVSQTEGSMTVEAALILPLLLFFFLNLLSSLEMIRLHGNLQTVLWNEGRQMAVYGYAYGKLKEGENFGDLLDLGVSLLSDAVLYENLVHELGKEYLEGSPLAHGAGGLNVLESSYLEEGDCIDLKVTYEVSPWVKIVGFRSFRMCNRYYGRAWTGYELRTETDGEGAGGYVEEYVYVTEHGTVYHEKSDCSYLKRTITGVSPEEARKRRNDSGGRYTPCELCMKAGHDGMVYITPDGDRYHSGRQCPSLKRDIRTLPREEAQSRYPPCSRCAGKAA